MNCHIALRGSHTAGRKQTAPMSKRTRRSTSDTPQWQPITQLPLIAKMIDDHLESVADVYRTLQEAQAHPGALDDATVNQTIRVYTEQREKSVWLYEDQLRRWAAQTLTDGQRREVERLTGQVKAWRETLTATLALATELKPYTIERLLAADDAEPGAPVAGGESGGRRPLTSQQLQAVETIDAWVKGIEQRGGNEEQMLAGMYAYMAPFKQILDTALPAEMDQLCVRYPGFQRFARLLEQLAEGIASGRISVPK